MPFDRTKYQRVSLDLTEDEFDIVTYEAMKADQKKSQYIREKLFGANGEGDPSRVNEPHCDEDEIRRRLPLDGNEDSRGDVLR